MKYIFSLLILGSLSVSTAADALKISWTNNLLTIVGSQLPGGKVDVWYLEAFCRKGSRGREWKQTVWPHQTTLISSTPERDRLQFETHIKPEVEMRHELVAREDEVEIRFSFRNKSDQAVDLEWFQPACIRVQDFTGCQQSNYTARSFIYTQGGLTLLRDTLRTDDALYRGGQVYLPAGIKLSDANPRPVSRDHPSNGLIGCFSRDDRWLLATASDQTHELFEGVYVCLHSDPHVGGLKGGETKSFRSKIYIMRNDPAALLQRYERDFPKAPR